MGQKSVDKYEQIRSRIKQFPQGPGLYFMKDSADRVLYIGKAKNLRSRAASYFQPSSDAAATRGPKIVEMLAKVVDVDYLETENEVEAVLKEARLIKDIRPIYNSDLIDDKSFPYLQITTSADYPGIYVTRKPQVKGSRLFGPFLSANDLRWIVVEMQKIFRFRTCNLDIREDDPKRKFFRPCILYSIKRCTAPCAAKISKSDYKKLISDCLRFLRSPRSLVLRQLKKQMEDASQKFEYEKAAMLRDRMRLIEKLSERGSPELDVQPEVFAEDPSEALDRLVKIFDLKQTVRIIEGIDVAHISGSDAVGSLVKFIDGRPFKAGYRRFKIKTIAGIDDCAMIAEVVRRRYKYAMAGEELWPDIILIDGGMGQLHAAEQAVDELQNTEDRKKRTEDRGQKTETKLISLAKREEEIYVQGRTEPLKLARTNPALKLLQYVRDEAHRFAQHYHHILRRKGIIEKNS